MFFKGLERESFELQHLVYFTQFWLMEKINFYKKCVLC